jgi:arylsulfatase A-like enzyme
MGSRVRLSTDECFLNDLMTADLPPSTPNIVYILADDMGFGDLRANNPVSKIPTPNLDRLAAGGMNFTDAHAPSSVCTPSRYAILTGRYCWRSPLKRGVLWPGDPPLIESDRMTVASFLQTADYETAAIGKWHLGLGWESRDGRPVNDGLTLGKNAGEARAKALQRVDYDRRFSGPTDVGFDSFFGFDAPNFPPYTWFQDDRVVEVPTEFRAHDKPNECGPGPAVPGWNLQNNMPVLAQKTEEFLLRKRDKPFFLYLALPSPHTPIVPNEEFHGKSDAGAYGDYVVETDAFVGRVLQALEKAGLEKKTLVIFTSDNGPEHFAYDRLKEFGHASAGSLRGVKRDTWEGGHRVPFLARWPEVIPPGSVCDQLISLADLLPTAAAIVGKPLDAGAAEDGVSILPLMKGQMDTPVRHYAIHHGMSGTFAIRSGDWVYIEAPGGSDSDREPEWVRRERGYEGSSGGAQLYQLRKEPGQPRNLIMESPEVAARLSELLAKVRGAERAGDVPPPSEILSE